MEEKMMSCDLFKDIMTQHLNNSGGVEKADMPHKIEQIMTECKEAGYVSGNKINQKALSKYGVKVEEHVLSKITELTQEVKTKTQEVIAKQKEVSKAFEYLEEAARQCEDLEGQINEKNKEIKNLKDQSSVDKQNIAQITKERDDLKNGFDLAKCSLIESKQIYEQTSKALEEAKKELGNAQNQLQETQNKLDEMVKSANEFALKGLDAIAKSDEAIKESREATMQLRRADFSQFSRFKKPGK